MKRIKVVVGGGGGGGMLSYNDRGAPLSSDGTQFPRITFPQKGTHLYEIFLQAHSFPRNKIKTKVF